MSQSYVVGGAIVVILAAGMLGGGINCLQARKSDEQSPKHPAYYFLLSVAAAFSVPLFLSLTKSELLKNVLTTANSFKPEDWFVLFAVCVVAAIYAQTFLESVSKKLLQRVEQAEQTAEKATKTADAANRDAAEAITTIDKHEQASELVEKKTAKKIAASPAVDMTALNFNSYSHDERNVLNALLDPEYDRRTLGGIAGATKIARTTLRPILEKLIGAGVVREIVGEKTGALYYQVQLDALRKPQS